MILLKNLWGGVKSQTFIVLSWLYSSYILIYVKGVINCKLCYNRTQAHTISSTS